jgi:Cu-Zn family superoxide dismutase
MHLHERGVCNPPNFADAGAHLNPLGKLHGVENPAGPHLGDLGNLVVNADGTAEFTERLARATLGKGEGSLLAGTGSALVIHAAPDDRRTDPSGNSGARIACGVLGPPRL